MNDMQIIAYLRELANAREGLSDEEDKIIDEANRFLTDLLVSLAPWQLSKGDEK